MPGFIAALSFDDMNLVARHLKGAPSPAPTSQGNADFTVEQGNASRNLPPQTEEGGVQYSLLAPDGNR